MKLNRGVLVMWMVTGAAMLAGCERSNGNSNDNAAPAEAAATTPVSDTDTTDETAPAAPPAPETESPGAPPASGDTYVPGSWRYNGGHYVWGKGHWERPRPGVQLVPAHWTEANGKWEHHPARWASGGHAVPAPAHPGEGHR